MEDVQSKYRAVVDGDRTPGSGLSPITRARTNFPHRTTGLHPWLYPGRSLRELQNGCSAREPLYTQNHAARMQDFRNQISRDDRFTEEEKANIIKASYRW